MGTLERITSPENIKSVCRKKADGRNTPEGDHSAVPSLKGALTEAGGGNALSSFKQLWRSTQGGCSFLCEDRHSHTETLKSSVQGKYFGEEGESVFKRSPSHLSIQKEIKEFLGSFQKQVSQETTWRFTWSLSLKVQCFLVLLHKFL